MIIHVETQEKVICFGFLVEINIDFAATHSCKLLEHKFYFKSIMSVITLNMFI